MKPVSKLLDYILLVLIVSMIAGTAYALPPTVTAGGTLAYTEGDGAKIINNLIFVGDTDSLNLTGATISISENYQAGADVLSFTPGNNITGTFNAVSGEGGG